MRKSVAALAFAGALLATPAAAQVSCYAGASAGKTITSTRVSDDISGPITLSADGLQGGAELGCDYAIDSLLTVGLLARGEVMDLSSKVGFSNISSDFVWTVALRGGIKINPDLLAYGLVGYSGTDLTLPGINMDPDGITYGGGLEFKVATDRLNAFIEYTRTEFEHGSLAGTSIRPSSDAVRVGIRYKFNMGGN
jgi:opacity protein-like surface antigen